jgi:MFS family permease
MSTSGRIITGPLALVLLANVGTLTSFFLLFSVTAMYAVAAGIGSGGAGLVTGVLLLGTVLAELAATSLMTRFGQRAVLCAGLSLLGLPALALLFPAPLALIVAVSFVRGFGFGLSGVVTGTLVAMLLPPDRRGEGLGLAGIAESVPAIVALPSGVWLAAHFGYSTVIVATAATALAPLVAFRWLPGSPARRRTAPGQTASDQTASDQTVLSAAGDSDGDTAGLLTALRDSGSRRLTYVFAASAAAAGLVDAFLPLAHGVGASIGAAGLLAAAVAATISRWWAGRHGDRHGHARLLLPGLVLSSLGMAAMIWLSSPAVVIAAMCVFGTGFGITENAIFAVLIERMPSRLGTASTLWNLAYDTGYGAGPAMFGLCVARTGYPIGFAIIAVLMLTVLPAAWRERTVTAEPVTGEPVIAVMRAAAGDQVACRS